MPALTTRRVDSTLGPTSCLEACHEPRSRTRPILARGPRLPPPRSSSGSSWSRRSRRPSASAALLAPRLAAAGRRRGRVGPRRRHLARRPARASPASRLAPAARAALRRHSEELSTSVSRARQSACASATDLTPRPGRRSPSRSPALVALGHGPARRPPLAPALAPHRRADRLDRAPHARRAAARRRRPAKGAPEFDVLRSAFRAHGRRPRHGARPRGGGGAAPGVPRPRAPGRARAQEPAHAAALRGRSASRQEARPDQQRAARDHRRRERSGIEQMARDFATLGRLPEGPPAPVDLGELVETLVQGTAPAGSPCASSAPPRPADGERALRAAAPRASTTWSSTRCDAVRGGGHGRTGARGARQRRPRARDRDRAARGGQRRGAGGRGRDPRHAASGIPPEQLGRVFEPYFTTKAQGHRPGPRAGAADRARPRRLDRRGERARAAAPRSPSPCPRGARA